jgi:predicted dehydrogenase
MKIGFVGAGMVGQMHLAQYHQFSDIRCTALAELRTELGTQVANMYAIPTLFSNHYEMLEQAELDAVIVVTRRNHTSKVVYDCLEAGKHVFSEKPMAKTLAQANKLAQAAQSNQKNYTVGYQKRHDPAVLKAKEYLKHLISSNELGLLNSINIWNFTGQDRDYDKPFCMTDEPRGGGVGEWEQEPGWLLAEHQESYDRFINVFCHDINILRFITEKEIHVAEVQLEDDQNIHLNFFIDQVPLKMHCGLRELGDWRDRGQWAEGLRFNFEQGSLSVEFPGPLLHGVCAKVVQEENGHQSIIHDGKVSKPVFYTQAENFIQHIQSGSINPANAEACVADLAIIEAIWKNHQGIK